MRFDEAEKLTTADVFENVRPGGYIPGEHVQRQVHPVARAEKCGADGEDTDARPVQENCLVWHSLSRDSGGIMPRPP